MGAEPPFGRRHESHRKGKKIQVNLPTTVKRIDYFTQLRGAEGDRMLEKKEAGEGVTEG